MTSNPLTPADGYLILKRGLYYRPNAMGYTGIRDKAGRYSLADAQAHADPISGVTFQHESAAPELAPNCLDEVANPYLLEKLEAARARCTALHNALTPSADTKAAYIGEIKFPVCQGMDDEGGEIWGDVTIPWDATKATMAMILGCAAMLDHPKYAPATQPGSGE